MPRRRSSCFPGCAKGKRGARQLPGAALLEKWPVVPLLPEPHCHLVGAGEGANCTYLIRVPSPPGVAGGISIRGGVWYGRDPIFIAVDVDVGRGRPAPGETYCIYSSHLAPGGAERDRYRCRRRSRCAAGYSGQDIDPAPSINVVWRSRSAAQGGSNMDGRVIQGCPARINLVLQARNSRPEQSHRARDMRSCHGCAIGKAITTITRVPSRTRASARSSDIRFYPPASIDSNRTAAAKESNGISAGVQGPDRVRCRIERRWIENCGTVRAGIACCDHHHDASSGLSFNGSLQCVNRTAFRCRATPGVDGNVRCLGRVALPAAYRVRRKEPFHTLDVSGGCAHPVVHVAATNPLCPRRHSDLVASPVITDRCAGGMRAVEVIIARKRRIITAGISHAVVDGVMPIVIVIGHCSVPAAVVRFKRVMRPANTSIGTRYHNILPVESERPDIRRVRVTDARFDRLRSPRLRRRLNRRTRLGKRILNVRIALYARHIRTGSQCLGDLAATLHQNCVNDVEGLMLEPAFTQPLQDWSLSRLTLIPQRIVHIAALFVLCRQSGRFTQVGLIGEHDEKFRLLAVRRPIQHPGGDLFHRGPLVKGAALIGSTQGAERPQRSDGSCDEE